MSERKQIIRDHWPRYLSEVTAGNKGRKIAVGVIGRPDVSPEGVSERASISVPLTDAPFLAMEYGPVEKGNAIIVSVGVEAVVYEHAVDAPVELTSNLDANFRVRNVRGEATGKPVPLRRPLYAIGFKGSRAEACFPNMPVK